MKTTRVHLMMLLCTAAYGTLSAQTATSTSQLTPNANDFSAYVPYNGAYSYGINPGYYGSNWNSQNLITISAGNSAYNVKGVGVKSVRMPLYDDYLTNYGLNTEVQNFQYYKSIGVSEITAFIGSPHSTHRFDTTFDGSPEPSKVFKNLYEPVWLDSAKTQINPNNYYAKYLYDVVNTYGQYVKFWEVVNEPDFTYSPAGWMGDGNPPQPGSWYDHNPTASELVNLRAPVFYYIREMRVAWEVIKRMSPQSYICTGGIGYRAFLDALLRNTDNPVDGSVTDQFPNKGGAYFDILSFHSYPGYNLKQWSNAVGAMVYYRHSDAAADYYIYTKHNMDSVLSIYGYNNTQYPKKQFICTENGVSRIMSGQDWGSTEGQRNYIIKAEVKAQQNGIKQTYWYQLGDNTDSTNQFDRMGMYYYFGNTTPYNASPTDQGIALKTTSDLLYGKVYDSAQTAALNLPAAINGAAFKGPNGTYTYVLWARTSMDLSETASASYSFPKALISTGYVTRKEWNFFSTNSVSTISIAGIALTGSPSFFELASAPNKKPKANAGNNLSITLPTNSVTLNGSGTDEDGTIAAYSWTKLNGPSQYAITTSNQPQTSITNLLSGIYQFELTVTDNLGATGTDTVTITVNPAPNKAPVAHAGNGQTIQLPLNSVLLSGSASDSDGTVTAYQWNKLSGPATYTISTPNSAQTSISSLTEGTYQFELQVTDNQGATGKDTLSVIVIAAPANVPPIAQAGNDQVITLPVNSIVLNGSGTDAEGKPLIYKWSFVSGPASYSIENPGLPQTMVHYLTAGTYKFELQVTDDQGAIGRDTVNIIVNPEPQVISTASLYPNPAHNWINIKIDAVTQQNLTSIRIYNMMGSLVYQEEFLRSQKLIYKKIDISNLKPGTYLVQINADINNTVTLKFIKQ